MHTAHKDFFFLYAYIINIKPFRILCVYVLNIYAQFLKKDKLEVSESEEQTLTLEEIKDKIV